MTRVIEDVNSVERVLIDGTEQGVVALVGVFGVGAILFYTNPTAGPGRDVADSRSWPAARFGTRSPRIGATAPSARPPAP